MDIKVVRGELLLIREALKKIKDIEIRVKQIKGCIPEFHDIVNTLLQKEAEIELKNLIDDLKIKNQDHLFRLASLKHRIDLINSC